MIALLSAGNALGSTRMDLLSLQRGIFLRPLAPALSRKRLFVFADKFAQLAAQQNRLQFHFSLGIHCFDLFDN
jgi:hypothetical protein